MDSSELAVQGEWPRLQGHACDALVVEEYWHEGLLDAPANVVWLRSGPNWHRLVIDCGVVFWRRSGPGPTAYSMPELQADVRLKDIGDELGLLGKPIDDVGGVPIPGGAEVWIQLQAGPRITFRNLNDRTIYYTG